MPRSHIEEGQRERDKGQRISADAEVGDAVHAPVALERQVGDMDNMFCELVCKLT